MTYAKYACRECLSKAKLTRSKRKKLYLPLFSEGTCDMCDKVGVVVGVKSVAEKYRLLKKG